MKTASLYEVLSKALAVFMIIDYAFGRLLYPALPAKSDELIHAVCLVLIIVLIVLIQYAFWMENRYRPAVAAVMIFTALSRGLYASHPLLRISLEILFIFLLVYFFLQTFRLAENELHKAFIAFISCAFIFGNFTGLASDFNILAAVPRFNSLLSFLRQRSETIFLFAPFFILLDTLLGLRLKKYSSKAALLAGASALVFVSSVFILAVWNMRLLSAFSGFLNVNRDVFTLTLVSRAVFAFCIAVRAVRARNVCSAFFLFLVFSVRIDNFTLFNYYLILLSYTVHLYISRPGYNYSAGQEA